MATGITLWLVVILYLAHKDLLPKVAVAMMAVISIFELVSIAIAAIR